MQRALNHDGTTGTTQRQELFRTADERRWILFASICGYRRFQFLLFPLASLASLAVSLHSEAEMMRCSKAKEILATCRG